MAQNVDPLAASKFCAKHCEDKDVSISSCFKKKALNLHPDRHPEKEDEFKVFSNLYEHIAEDDKQKKCNDIRAAPAASSPSPVPAPAHAAAVYDVRE